MWKLIIRQGLKFSLSFFVLFIYSINASYSMTDNEFNSMISSSRIMNSASMNNAENSSDVQEALSPEEEKLKGQLLDEILDLSKDLNDHAIKPELSVQALYDGFKFNSTTGDFYNRFYGRTQFINLGGDNLEFYNYTMGYNVTAINTRMNGSQSLAPNNFQYTTTSIDNTAIQAHALRRLSNNFSVDVAGGVGQSQYSLSNNSIFPEPGIHVGQVPIINQFGTGHLSGFNEYLGGRFMAAKPLSQRLILQGDAGYIFSNYQQPAYDINFTDGTTSKVLSLITRVGLLSENLRLTYQVNDQLQPFIFAGLVQVTSLSYSNPIIQPTTVSPLPQLSIPNSGFLLGGGLSYEYKFFRINPMYQFSQRGTTYFDNLGALKIDLIF